MKERYKNIILVLFLCLFGVWTAEGSTGKRNWVSLDRVALQAASTVQPSGSADVTRYPADGKGVSRIDVRVDGFWKTKYRPESAPSIRANSAKTDVQQYDMLQIPGWTHMSEIGKPALPIKRLLIPVNTTGDVQVKVTSKTEASIEALNVIPVQPPFPDVFPEPPRPEFAQDAKTYQSKMFFPPDNLVRSEVVGMGDSRFVMVELAAIRYVPESGEAVAATDLQVEIVEDETPVEITALSPDAETLAVYMILMDDQFEGNSTLNTFIDWKKRKGYDVRIVKTSDINASGSPVNSEIVAYMRALDAADYPDYLLILGDHTAANGVQGFYFSTYAGGYTDLDIACRTSTDWVPDLYYGRMPATDNTSATRMLSKALAMDRSPPLSGMFTNVIIAGQIQDSDDGGNNQADRLFCETGDALASYFEQDPSSKGFSCTRAVVNPDGMTASGKWAIGSILWSSDEQIGDRIYTNFVLVVTAQDRITQGINRGTSLIFHRDHGYSDGTGWADPHYNYFNVGRLTNAENRTAVLSINCASGAYHKNNNFARAWIEHVNGGAYAVFAPVDISYSWRNDWLTHGFMTAFTSNYISFQNNSVSPDWSNDLPTPSGTYGTAGSALRLGEILNFGKMYMYENYFADKITFQLFHCFGDPEAYLMLGEPKTLSVAYTPVVRLGAQTVTVSVAESDCRVCLYSPAGGIHETRTTDAGGSAEFSLNLTNNCTIYVTVTGAGKRPYEGSILAVNGDPFSCSAFALTNNVMLRWSNPQLSGYANPNVRIAVGTNDYPADTSEGTVIYTGTNGSYLHNGLINGQTYFYSFWVTDDGANWTNPP